MSKINDGGQAFPSNEIDQDGVPNGWQHKGMSIRDWFAGHALSSVVMACANDDGARDALRETGSPAPYFASCAYAIADAMLSEREKTNAEP